MARVREIVEQTQRVRRTVDVLCNLCGGSCRLPRLPERHPGTIPTSFYGLIEATVTGAYESDVLEDCTWYRFSLCERCLAELFARCKVPVQTGEYVPFREIDPDEDGPVED